MRAELIRIAIAALFASDRRDHAAGPEAFGRRRATLPRRERSRIAEPAS